MTNPFVYLYAVCTGRLARWNDGNALFAQVWNRVQNLPEPMQSVMEEFLGTVAVLQDRLLNPLRGNRRALPVDVKLLTAIQFAAVTATLLEGVAGMFSGLNPRLRNTVERSLGILLGSPEKPFDLFESVRELGPASLEESSRLIYQRLVEIVGVDGTAASRMICELRFTMLLGAATAEAFASVRRRLSN